jgi:PHP family Zn ribbon phosphoesterase
MQTTYTYKKHYSSKDRLFSLRKYEIAWSEESGFHPHLHLQIGTTNQTPLKEIESEFKTKWIEIVMKHAPDRTMIPSEDYCCHLVSNPSLEHSMEKVEILSRGRRNFNQEGLQKIVMDNDSAADETPLIEPNLFKKIVNALKIIYKNCLNRYRYVFQVNKRHPLFIENDIGYWKGTK